MGHDVQPTPERRGRSRATRGEGFPAHSRDSGTAFSDAAFAIYRMWDQRLREESGILQDVPLSQAASAAVLELVDDADALRARGVTEENNAALQRREPPNGRLPGTLLARHGPSPTSCTDQCVIVAAPGAGSPYAGAPIAFASS